MHHGLAQEWLNSMRSMMRIFSKKVMNNEKCKNDDNFNRAQIGATRSCPEMVEQHELSEFHLCPPGDTTKSIPEITKSIPK